MPGAHTSSGKFFAAGILFIAVCVLAVFGRTSGFSFVEYDDHQHLYENDDLAACDLAHLGQIWSHPAILVYAPVSETFWLVMAAVARRGALPADYPKLQYGLDPLPFHVASILLHLINTLLVIALARRLQRGPQEALLAGAFFAFHPLQIETVCWLSAGRDLISVMFGLSACHFWLAGDDVAAGRRWRLTGAAVCYGLAVLSKPWAVVLPLMALCLTRLQTGSFRTSRTRAWLAGAGCALALPVVLLARHMEAPSPLFYPTTLAERGAIALDALGFYLGRIVWPQPLTPFYGRTPMVVLQSEVWHYTMLAPLFAILWFAASARMRRLPLGPLLCLFGAALLPYLGLVPFTHQNISTVSDRYLYGAMIAPGLCFGWIAVAGARLATRFARRRTGEPAALTGTAAALLSAAIAVLIVGLLAATTFRQTLAWRDTPALMDHALAVADGLPPSWNLHYTYAAALLKRDRLAEAEEHYRTALDLEPRCSAAHFDLGIVYSRRNQPDRALAAYLRALEITPDMLTALINAGAAYFAERRYSEAMVYLKKAVELQSDSPLTQYNYAALLAALGRRDEAIPYLTRALERNSGFTAARTLLHQLSGTVD